MQMNFHNIEPPFGLKSTIFWCTQNDWDDIVSPDTGNIAGVNCKQIIFKLFSMELLYILFSNSMLNLHSDQLLMSNVSNLLRRMRSASKDTKKFLKIKNSIPSLCYVLIFYAIFHILVYLIFAWLLHFLFACTWQLKMWSVGNLGRENSHLCSSTLIYRLELRFFFSPVKITTIPQTEF